MQSLVVYFTHLSLVLSVRYGLITASRSLQAKGEMCTLQTRKLCYNAINISGGSWGGAMGDPGPHFSTKMRPEPSPPSPSPPYLNINYVLVLVYMQNCKRAQSLVCHGLS